MNINNESVNVIRPEPLEDAILRLAKKYELCSWDKEVFGSEAKDTYSCVASELLEVLKGNYVIGKIMIPILDGFPVKLKCQKIVKNIKGRKLLMFLLQQIEAKLLKFKGYLTNILDGIGEGFWEK